MKVEISSRISTPRLDGFWMPGEFEPHAGCWMLWPERPDVWRERARPAQAAFAAVAAAVARFEPVWLGVSDRGYARARQMVPESVTLLRLRYNDAWMRDNGPTFVRDSRGEVRGIDWEFNAWGGLYPDWQDDDALAKQVLELRGYGRYKCDLVMEGGAIDVDGQGTLIATEQTLLNPNRNPGLSRTEVEAKLAAYLGVRKVIWLAEGVHADETDGHVDNLCCFTRPGVVALTWTDRRDDPQYEISRSAYERLAGARDARGRPLRIVKIHKPAPLRMTAAEAAGLERVPGTFARHTGDYLSSSYINYYVANGGVVVPQFGVPEDERALSAIAALYPERAIVGVQSREILLGGGNVHCITQQEPVGVKSKE